MPLFSDESEIERADLYRLLAAVFLKPPADDILARFEGIEGFKFGEKAHEIGHDFHDLFIHNAVPLYESFYDYPVGDEPKLWGKAAFDVKRFYESAGLTMDEELPMVPDHISAELLFMSYLVENERIAEQGGFIEDHLIKWVPVFCEELHDHAKTGFYREIANLLKELVSSDYDDLRGG